MNYIIFTHLGFWHSHYVCLRCNILLKNTKYIALCSACLFVFPRVQDCVHQTIYCQLHGFHNCVLIVYKTCTMLFIVWKVGCFPHRYCAICQVNEQFVIKQSGGVRARLSIQNKNVVKQKQNMLFLYHSTFLVEMVLINT